MDMLDPYMNVSVIETVEARRTWLMMDKPLPNLVHDLTDIDEPTFTWSRIEMPSVGSPSTNVFPNTLIVDPNRLTARTEKQLPRCKKSRTDIRATASTFPNTLKEDPR
jgi:hypothetical protein